MSNTATEWALQPFFVIQDDAYDRMMSEFTQGSKAEWSFPCCACPSFPSRCSCPKMLNTHRNGEIARLVRGEWKPVYKQSEMPKMEGALLVNVFESKYIALGSKYTEFLMNISKTFPMDVCIHFDHKPSAGGYNTTTFTVATRETCIRVYTIVQLRF